MGKQGPCGHCGIATTPLWRNGPPEKPVLCNACGSRWRTKGTLLNYMPMHSGGFGGSMSPEGPVLARARKNQKSFSEPRSRKRKEPSEGHQERGPLRSQLPSFKGAADDSVSASSMSSYTSGSDGGVLFTRSPVQSDSAASSPLWQGRVPSRKRTSMVRACTSVDKLIRRFQGLLCQGPAARSLHTSDSAEAILVDSKPSTMADEIGLGSIFIRQPMLQNESESYGNAGEPKSVNTISQDPGFRQRGGPLTQLPNGAEFLASIRGKEKAKPVKKLDGGGRVHHDRLLVPNKALLEHFPYNKRDVLQSCQSPLVFLELKDIINFDTFTGLLTDKEQGQLTKILSSEDIAKSSESLREMFTCAQFEGSLANFHQLLSEGMFDSSELGANPRVLQHFQQLLTLTDLTSSGWMERCSQFQNRSRRRVGSANCNKSKDFNKEKLKGNGLPSMTSASPSNKQSPGRRALQFGAGVHEETMTHIGTYKQNGGLNNGLPFGGVTSGKTSEAVKFSQDLGSSSNDGVFGFEAGGTCFAGNNMLPTDRGCGVGSNSEDDLPDLQAPGSDETEAELLFNMPTNMMSLQDTEFLQQPIWPKTKNETDPSQVENGSLITSNIWHMDSSPSELFWNPTCAGPVYAFPNGTVLNPGRMLM